MTIFRAHVWDKTTGYCWYCGGALNPFENFCVDHAIPRKRGGTNHIDNLFPACRKCNIRKAADTLEEFRASLTADKIPTLTDLQRAYLVEIGVALPDTWPTPSPYVFWGERTDKG